MCFSYLLDFGFRENSLDCLLFAGSFGIPSACRKKRFLDKVKLTIIMRDGINRLLKECKHVTDESRRNIIIYGWLQVGKFNMRKFQKIPC